ncbi:MAG: sugar phosphate isomerase/epimerase [Clostridiales bacterium]|nr:sugar phosphate isomerase/epimerase [Clostridiales bacterium]
MKLSVTTYSFGSYIDKLGLTGIIDKTAEMGFDGIEFVEHGEFNDLDEAKKIGDYAREKGLEVVAYCVGANFLKEDLDGEIERVKKHVDIAAALGAKNMRHDVGYGMGGRKYSIGYDDALPALIKGTTEVTKYAEQKGVGTMSENHGLFSQDANRVEKLINGVAHPNFGALVDLGNFMCADEDPTLSVGIMAPYAKHVHAKDFFWKSGVEINPGEGWFQTRAKNYLRGAIIGQGAAKIYQSIQILKGVGYDGYVTVEFEGMEDNLKGIRIGKDNLTRFING